MRLWMTDVSKLCRQHLLGEHREIHTMIGTLRKGNNINGYLEGLYDISKLILRHTEIVEEMERRGYKHESLINASDELMICEWVNIHGDSHGWVNVIENEKELKRRCKECKY